MKNLDNLHMITCTGKDIATEFIEKAHLNIADTIIINDRKNKIKQYCTAQKINKSKEYITKRIKNFLIPSYEKISSQFPEIFLNNENVSENEEKDDIFEKCSQNITCFKVLITIQKIY